MFGCTHPFGQDVHISVSPPSKNPAPHGSHDVAFASGWTNPLRHGWHDGSPVVFEKLPGAHGEQLVWFDSYLPNEHAVHVVFAELTMWPGPQPVHAVTLPVVEYVPAPHAVFVVVPLTTGHSKPPGHAEHVAVVATPASS